MDRNKPEDGEWNSAWKGAATRVTAPYTKKSKGSGIQSNAGHEEPRAKAAGPSAKAKYYLKTDSGPVP